MRRITLAVSALLVLSGCESVDFFRPLFTERDLVREPGLSGEWRGPEGVLTVSAYPEDPQCPAWRFQPGDRLRLEGDLWDWRFKARACLVRLGGVLYADVVVVRPGIPSHNLLRVEAKGEQLRISLLDQEWMVKQLKAGALPYELVTGFGDEDRHYVVMAG
ncbi:MAG: hypothetical protein N2036_13365, partial [Bryobacteraceae bacterium]|nr:hypothetical protein [Bryobacteraceae bacterium]